MTKSDYILLARAIQSSELDDKEKHSFAEHLSLRLKKDNPRFMAEKFVNFITGGESEKVKPPQPKPEPPSDMADASIPSDPLYGQRMDSADLREN